MRHGFIMFTQQQRIAMKNTVCALSLAALSFSAYADSNSYVEKAIKKGRPDAIKALVKAGFTFDQSAIDGYIQKAQDKLTEKEAAQSSFALKHLDGPELALVGINTTALLATAFVIYKHYHNEDKWSDTEKFLSIATFTASVTSGLKSLVTLYKDVKKEGDKHKAFIKAEKVLRAVESLKPTRPQITDH